MKKYILKIYSEDEKGLIYRISDVIFKFGLNIAKNHEFVDHEVNKFFYRAEIHTDEDIDKCALTGLLSAMLGSKAHIELIEAKKKNIVIMATKETHCLGDLLIKNYSKEINANILSVIANYDDLRDLVEKFGIKFHCVEAGDLDRLEHEKKILEVLKEYDIDYIVLAKYMRILSPNFVNAYKKKIINIHHSFLPAFIGANPYKQAFERGVKIVGATAHFVNNDLDEGPIITQDIIRVNHEMNWKEMRVAGRNVEKNVLASALELVFDDRVFVYNNKTVIF
ncbi:formyltetrahydrofolate deformylase [Campylobacter ureolyticus]|uniref:Formyltetrahydrofolate deformylase n=1 Tax=Campylobacter ureolyticus TaxID=827 RepID=A0A381E5K1_9BACT|nr:formyltetrahydrofolate deformylase [Campylobacter ureolyticus]MCR8685156.1 formyltetrahydrofolate deformylase [Campylobacter ureolyticus]MCZ6103960.1 formyltetrahydrofolate deformylase [Campylobacter ureolyticus]MCZ6132673.1 formyltetrahydrofolate deformylase [Campylobacter ureolyticus]MCZ6135218.1 formyltetrahydrofolate deformylase [Campylobacter ureolyticus]MCZ6162280.1 formyltetrahydrofolate deformylase [Campylobacter ureolyticus]